MRKIAILTSHPIQYQAPFFKKLAAEPGVDLTVFFSWDYGVKETYDYDFRQKIKWDIPLLDGYKFEFLKNLSFNPKSSCFFGEINPGIVGKITGGDYDVWIIFGWQSLTHWIAIVTAFLRRVPVYLRGENPLSQEFNKSTLKRALKQVVLRGLFKLASGFLYIGEENRKFYRYYGVPESKLHFIPYAIDNERFVTEAKKLKPEKTKLKASLGIGANEKVILFAGKLIEKKRPLDLLKAYQLLITNYQLPIIPSLVFVGNGPLRTELEKYTKEHSIKNVHFTGFKNQSEIPRYYAIADIFVLPSGFGETWGLVVNEAMCFGLPIIVSDVVGCGPDLVKNGENGFIVPVGNINALKEAMVKSLSSDKIRKQFGERSFGLIKSYSFNRNIEVIMRLLKK